MLSYVLILDYTVTQGGQHKHVWITSRTRMVLEKNTIHSHWSTCTRGSSASKDTDFGPSPETQSLHTQLQLLILSTQLSFEWPCGLFYYTHQFYYLFYWLFYRKSGCKASSVFNHSFFFQQDTQGFSIFLGFNAELSTQRLLSLIPNILIPWG